MNSQIRNQRPANSNSNNKKPFCKVCFDAGKPESEYTNHYTRDKPGLDGKVVCPTLKNLECKYCFKKGHTVSYCKVLADFKNGVVRLPATEKKEPEKKEKKPLNMFASLCEEEEEEEKKEELKVVAEVIFQNKFETSFPCLSKVAPKAQVVTGYAQMAALPYVAAPPKAVAVTTYSKYSEPKWLDYEDEDEEYYVQEDDQEEDEEIVIVNVAKPCYSYAANDDDSW
jgi:hypothetical protein